MCILDLNVLFQEMRNVKKEPEDEFLSSESDENKSNSSEIKHLRFNNDRLKMALAQRYKIIHLLF